MNADKINDGGPAFPGLNAEFTGISSEGQEHYEIQPSGGMTLRDYFAAKALQAIVSSDVWNIEAAGEEPAQAHHVATEAYAIADAMLKARSA